MLPAAPPDPGLPGMLQGPEWHQEPRVPCRKGTQVHLGPSSVDEASPSRALWAPGCPLRGCPSCLPHAPSSWPAEGSQQPTLPYHVGSVFWSAFWAEPLLPGC